MKDASTMTGTSSTDHAVEREKLHRLLAGWRSAAEGSVEHGASVRPPTVTADGLVRAERHDRLPRLAEELARLVFVASLRSRRGRAPVDWSEPRWSLWRGVAATGAASLPPRMMRHPLIPLT